MSLKSALNKVKGKLDAFQKKRSEKYNVNMASKLQRLKVARERIEGKARLAERVSEERRRIANAQRNVSEYGFAGKVRRFSKNAHSSVKSFKRSVGRSPPATLNKRGFVRTESKVDGSVDRRVFKLMK